MTHQVMDIRDNGRHFKVIFDHKAKCNPYRIYEIAPVFTDHGVTYSKKLMDKYANLASCFYWFLEHKIGFQDVFHG